MKNETMMVGGLNELINAINEALADSATSEELSEQEVFDKEIESDTYSDVYTSTCAMLMAISTTKDIPLENVIDMYAEKVRKELDTDHIRELMRLGKYLVSGRAE